MIAEVARQESPDVDTEFQQPVTLDDYWQSFLLLLSCPPTFYVTELATLSYDQQVSKYSLRRSADLPGNQFSLGSVRQEETWQAAYLMSVRDPHLQRTMCQCSGQQRSIDAVALERRMRQERADGNDAFSDTIGKGPARAVGWCRNPRPSSFCCLHKVLSGMRKRGQLALSSLPRYDHPSLSGSMAQHSYAKKQRHSLP